MKKILITLCIMVFVFIGTGCASNKLSSDFDETAIKKSAREVIELVNKGDYSAIYEKMSETVKNSIKAEDLEKAVKPTIDKLGSFDAYSKEMVVGQKDDKTEEDYATAVMIAKYEESKVQFTISFNKDMEVNGFFIK